jgi:hypothetical protein
MAPRVALIASLALMLVASSGGRPAQADWQSDLRLQLRTEHDCEVAFFSRVSVEHVAGREVVFVHVYCVDQRAFDAERKAEGEPFEIKDCRAAAC